MSGTVLFGTLNAVLYFIIGIRFSNCSLRKRLHPLGEFRCVVPYSSVYGEHVMGFIKENGYW